MRAGTNHRWSVSSDKDGQTLCLSKTEPTTWAGGKKQPTVYVPLSEKFTKVFTKLKAEIQSSLETMLADSNAECAAVTKKRDASKVILDSKSAAVSTADKVFSTSFAAQSVMDSSCTQNTAVATATLATKNYANSELSTRDPVIQKELDILDKLLSLIGTLKSINLQVDVDVDARASASQSLHESVMLLQSMNDEAGPLAEMVELAREHQEFTKPILDLLNQLKAKLLKERDTLRTAATRESDAYNVAAEKATKSCASKDAKTAEMCACSSCVLMFSMTADAGTLPRRTWPLPRPARTRLRRNTTKCRRCGSLRPRSVTLFKSSTCAALAALSLGGGTLMQHVQGG